MDVIVLVGGEGTRLRPLTYDVPKQMLPILDRTLIEHVVTWLGRNGLDRAVLSLGYRPDAFVDAFPTGTIAGVRLAYAVEPEPLDTAGAVRFAADRAGVTGRCVVINGDVLTDLDIGTLIRFHDEHGAEATIHLTPVEDPSAFGVVPTDGDGRVLQFVEKPPPGTAPTNLINAGTYVLEPSVFDRIPDGRRVSIERETFPLLIGGGRLFALATADYWLDTGTPSKYLQAQLDILKGARTRACPPAAAELRPGVFLAEGARVAGELSGVAYVGPGAVVEAGAAVTDCVLGAGARVASGATVVGSSLLPGAQVGDGCMVSESIVGAGTIVRPGASLAELTVVRGGTEVPAGLSLRGRRFPE